MKSAILEKKDGWPSGKVRLILLAGFGGLLALMVIADLEALRVARELHGQEGKVRQRFLERGHSLSVLSSTIHIYNDRIQEYVLSQDPQSDNRAELEFSRLTREITSTMRQYPEDRQPEEQVLLESLRRLFAEQQDMVNPFFSWSREERRRQALRILDEEVLPQEGQIIQTSEEIKLWNNRQIGEAERALFAAFMELQGRQIRLLITALAAGLILSLACALYILRLERQGQLRYQELARSRRELEQLSARLVEAQESERRSISCELHDEVGQSLGALLVDIGRLSSLVPSESLPIRESLDKIKSVAAHTLETVRDIALLLRPSMLDDLGLLPALEWQGRELSRRTEMEVEVHSDNVPESLPDEYKICIYRFVQEALHNAARHSEAKTARVDVQGMPGRILITVADDGRGFDPQRERGLGILGMEERIKRMGGVLMIDSKPGRGTRLKADLPLR